MSLPAKKSDQDDWVSRAYLPKNMTRWTFPPAPVRRQHRRCTAQASSRGNVEMSNARSSKSKWSEPCTQDDPITSIMDDIGLDNESFSVVIVGGGPHALAALAALASHEDGMVGPAGSRPTALAHPASSSHGTCVHRSLCDRSWLALHAVVEQALRGPGDQPPALACLRSPCGLRAKGAGQLCHSGG